MLARVLPSWLRGYERPWLRADVIAGVVIWSVVTPQAVAYAQIAGLPPAAGLMAAPGALLAYALLGTSRQLVVGATTATAAVSAAAVGGLADGNAARFAALSAALALVTAVVFMAAGVLHLGGIADFISKPVMTGFLFGLGLVIALGQLPKLLGVKAGEGNFFPALADVLGELGDIQATTLAVGAGSVAVLVVCHRLLPALPATLLVLAGAILVSALLDLSAHGVAVVGNIPNALPDPAIPDVSADDVVALVTPALGVMFLSAEGIGVARALAVKHGYPLDVSRDLRAFGASNLLSGLSSGFVQCGGASQTAAADGAGARTQIAGLIAAGLVLLTGAFLAPLFEDLPEATLGAIVIVAVSGFFNVAELRRFAYVRRSAIFTALLALVGVLALGVLQGLVIAAGLSLVYVLERLGRPSVGALARDPATGVWGRADRHEGWEGPAGALVVRSDGPFLYPNANLVKNRVLALAAEADRRPRTVVLDMSPSIDLDLQTADTLGELREQLERDGIELRLAAVRVPARHPRTLRRGRSGADHRDDRRGAHRRRRPRDALTRCGPRSSGASSRRPRCTSARPSHARWQPDRARLGWSWASARAPCAAPSRSREDRTAEPRIGGPEGASFTPCAPSVVSQRRGELALDIEVDVVADVDLDLVDRSAGEWEPGPVLPADGVAAVAADGETFAAEGEVAGLGAQRCFGDDLVVDIELARAMGLVALAAALLDELDAQDVVARFDLAVGDELLLGREADEVVGVPELAVLDEQRVAAEARPCA